MLNREGLYVILVPYIYIYIYRNNDVCVKNMTCKCTLNALKKNTIKKVLFTNQV